MNKEKIERMRKLLKTRELQRGMTLLEVMVVIVILGIIGSMVGVYVMGRLEKAKKDAAKIQIKNFENALEHYKLSFGRYPTDSEGGLRALSSPPQGEKPIMKDIPKDPWGNEYVYICPGFQNPDGFDIKSYGSDGVEGGSGDGEDITN